MAARRALSSSLRRCPRSTGSLAPSSSRWYCPVRGNVLGEASGDVSDGAHPERQEVRAGTRSIAHEIPPKPPLSGRARQLILLLSEVVEADPPVPAAGERLHRHLEETELVVTPGE
jgi:hypothetical protein